MDAIAQNNWVNEWNKLRKSYLTAGGQYNTQLVQSLGNLGGTSLALGGTTDSLHSVMNWVKGLATPNRNMGMQSSMSVSQYNPFKNLYGAK